MCECAGKFVSHNSAVVENFLELRGGFAALMRGQIGFASHIHGIESLAARRGQLIGTSILKSRDGLRWIVTPERKLRLQSRLEVVTHGRVLWKPLTQIVGQCLCPNRVPREPPPALPSKTSRMPDRAKYVATFSAERADEITLLEPALFNIGRS